MWSFGSIGWVTLSSQLKMVIVAIFKLAKLRAKLWEARNTLAFAYVLQSLPCDQATHQVFQRAASLLTQFKTNMIGEHHRSGCKGIVSVGSLLTSVDGPLRQSSHREGVARTSQLELRKRFAPCIPLTPRST
jgi:hypothetical protein